MGDVYHTLLLFCLPRSHEKIIATYALMFCQVRLFLVLSHRPTKVKKYTHVQLRTRDRTVGVKSIFCAPAGRVKGNVSVTSASRTSNSCSLAFSTSFRSHNSYQTMTEQRIGESSRVTSPAKAITTTLIRQPTWLYLSKGTSANMYKYFFQLQVQKHGRLKQICMRYEYMRREKNIEIANLC